MPTARFSRHVPRRREGRRGMGTMGSSMINKKAETILDEFLGRLNEELG